MQKVPSMVDMAIKPVEIKNVQILPDSEEGCPVYPYGLTLSLNDETLDKLRMEEGCEVGDMIHFHCLAKVTSCSDHENAGQRVELQIVAMSAEDEDSENEDAEEKMPKGMNFRKMYSGD